MRQELPNDLMFMRHGQSVPNLAIQLAKQGDYELIESKAYRETPSRDFRLTEVGVEQCRLIGGVIAPEIQERTTAQRTLFLTSPYIRSVESAYHLNFEGVDWVEKNVLRERDWGDIESLSPREHEERYPENFMKMKNDPFFWRPPGGESLAQITDVRIQKLLDFLFDQTADFVFMAGHGEFIDGVRYVFESKTHDEWLQNKQSNKAASKIENGQILHYSRLSPIDKARSRNYSWVRHMTPGDKAFSEWREIDSDDKVMTRDDMKRQIHQAPIINTRL